MDSAPPLLHERPVDRKRTSAALEHRLAVRRNAQEENTQRTAGVLMGARTSDASGCAPRGDFNTGISRIEALSDTVASELRKTPLHARHRASRARMVPYAGWEMPVDSPGISNEHLAVRTRAGVFVSHMGEIEIAGKNALAAVQLISSNDASLLQTGQAQYAALTTSEGTFVDDMLVYRMAPSHFMLVVNAANTAKDFAWISGQIKAVGDVAAIDSSSRYALIAVRSGGARSSAAAGDDRVVGDRSLPLRVRRVAAARATISRTGYTGEDGFEIFVPPDVADRLWQAILGRAGRPR